jgi:DUF971 family protein
MHGDPLASPTRPVDIAQIGRTALRVRWADGHASEFPLPLLRRICRCAACKGHEPAPASASPFRVLGPEPSAAPAALEQVGNYGLGVHWTDGHYSIYAFDALRHDCPCPECAGRTGAAPRDVAADGATAP